MFSAVLEVEAKGSKSVRTVIRGQYLFLNTTIIRRGLPMSMGTRYT